MKHTFPIKLDFNHLGLTKTKGLFKQYKPDGEHDINEWREIFVSAMDPHEYRGAIALVGNWSDWVIFKRQWKYFTNSILPEWMDEIEVRMRSEGVQSLLLQTRGDKPSPAAAKFLAEAGYKEKKRGRPSKDEVARAASIEARMSEMWADDIERVSNTEF